MIIHKKYKDGLLYAIAVEPGTGRVLRWTRDPTKAVDFSQEVYDTVMSSSTVAVPPPSPKRGRIPCKFEGNFLTGREREAASLSHMRPWRHCLNPNQPLGPNVCRCQGCNSTCPGYSRRPDGDDDTDP